MQTIDPPTNGTPTSDAAAEAAQPKAAAIREQVFEAIKASGDDGLTDEQIQEQLGLDGNTQRPRRWELSSKQGRIRESGTRKTRFGRDATVWVANKFVIAPTPKATQPKQVTVTHKRNGEPIRQFKSFVQTKGNAQTVTFPQAAAILSGDEVTIS
jgi:hypothetical protein